MIVGSRNQKYLRFYAGESNFRPRAVDVHGSKCLIEDEEELLPADAQQKRVVDASCR